MNLIEHLRRRYARVTPLPPGMLHARVTPAGRPPYRLHLRMRPDGSGLLVVNASTVLHLNPSACEYAYHLIKGSTPEEAGRAIAARYNVSRRTATRDFVEFSQRIQALIETPDLDPVTFLDFERLQPYSQPLSAPYRLDCALTYRLPPGASADDAPHKRVERELSTDEWKTILDRAWAVGIPHVTFTGGEPTLREDLAELIAHAEAKGMVSGLLSDGLRLSDDAYRRTLLNTGLDHLLFLLNPADEASWNALTVIMPEDLFTVVHLTITPANAARILPALDRVQSLGVTHISLTAAPGATAVLQTARDRAAELGLSLVWDLPAPYSAQNPVSLETAEDQAPSGAGRAWLYVEPDGDVLPAQGMADRVLGNFLRDPWEKIYTA